MSLASVYLNAMVKNVVQRMHATVVRHVPHAPQRQRICIAQVSLRRFMSTSRARNVSTPGPALTEKSINGLARVSRILRSQQRYGASRISSAARNRAALARVGAAELQMDGEIIRIESSLASGASYCLSALAASGEPPMEAFGVECKDHYLRFINQGLAPVSYVALHAQAEPYHCSSSRGHVTSKDGPSTGADGASNATGVAASGGGGEGAGGGARDSKSGQPPTPSGEPTAAWEHLLNWVLENPHYVLLSLFGALVVWFYRGFADGSARTKEVDEDEQERAVAPVEFRQLRDINALGSSELIMVAAAALEAFHSHSIDTSPEHGDGANSIPVAPAGEFLDLAEATIRRVRQARRAAVAAAALSRFEAVEQARQMASSASTGDIRHHQGGPAGDASSDISSWSGWFGGGSSASDAAAEARQKEARRVEALRAALAMHPEAEGLKGRHHLERWALATAARRRGMRPAPVGEDETAKAEHRDSWVFGFKPEAVGLRQADSASTEAAKGEEEEGAGQRGARDAMANLGSTGSVLGGKGGAGPAGIRHELFPIAELLVVLCAALGGSVDEKADLVLAFATCPELRVDPALASMREVNRGVDPPLPSDYEGLQAAFALYKKVTRSRGMPKPSGETLGEDEQGEVLRGNPSGTWEGEGDTASRPATKMSATLAQARSLLPAVFPADGLSYLRESGASAIQDAAGSEAGGPGATLPSPGEVDARLAPSQLVDVFKEQLGFKRVGSKDQGNDDSAVVAEMDLSADPLVGAIGLQLPLTPRTIWRGEMRGAIALLVSAAQIPSEQRTRRASVWPMPRWRRCTPTLHLIGAQDEAAVLPAPTSTSSGATAMGSTARDSTGSWDPSGLQAALEAEADSEAVQVEQRAKEGTAQGEVAVSAVELAAPRVPLRPLPSDQFVLSREDAVRLMWTDSVCAWGECPAFRAPDFYD